MMRRRYVYFAKAGDRVKVGCSSRPASRLSQVAEWVPFEIELMGTLRGSFALESSWHSLLAEHWIHAEWFHLTPEVASLIEAALAGEKVKLPPPQSLSNKLLQKRQKAEATRRVNQAENVAGRPAWRPERERMRPQYVIDAMASYAGGNPPPDAEAWAAIERYELELEVRAS